MPRIIVAARSRGGEPGNDRARTLLHAGVSASEVPKGTPAPDLFLHAAAQMQVEPDDCIAVEDSPAGVTAATAAGMTAIGFVGGSHAGGELGHALMRSGARTVIADLRQLKGIVAALRGW
jgi:beta-phosphoglucomutase-like phosphatase (HAD superfamily)